MIIAYRRWDFVSQNPREGQCPSPTKLTDKSKFVFLPMGLQRFIIFYEILSFTSKFIDLALLHVYDKFKSQRRRSYVPYA